MVLLDTHQMTVAEIVAELRALGSLSPCDAKFLREHERQHPRYSGGRVTVLREIEKYIGGDCAESPWKVREVGDMKEAKRITMSTPMEPGATVLVTTPDGVIHEMLFVGQSLGIVVKDQNGEEYFLEYRPNNG